MEDFWFNCHLNTCLQIWIRCCSHVFNLIWISILVLCYRLWFIFLYPLLISLTNLQPFLSPGLLVEPQSSCNVLSASHSLSFIVLQTVLWYVLLQLMVGPTPLLFPCNFKPVTASVLSVSQLCSLLELATLLVYVCLFSAAHLCPGSLSEVRGWRLLNKNNFINKP